MEFRESGVHHLGKKTHVPFDIGSLDCRRKGLPFRGQFPVDLIRIYNKDLFRKVLQALDDSGIRVLDTSNMPLLENTFRVSLGSYDENTAVLECLAAVMEAYLKMKCWHKPGG